MNLAHDMDDFSDVPLGPMKTVLAEEYARHEAERMAMLTAGVGKADRMEGVWVEMQGRPAWPARRCSPEMAVWVPDDDAPKDAMSPAEAVLLAVIYCISAIFTVWLVMTIAAAWSN